ncbi:helix-turn-helix domain-containing protein [Pseudoalteromonas luteoviolacea]|uniref:helix-turn-helix domain-containing protein n=1 Tax=Pseudoalteromonas luteoviolacea TaxID=43657 RepID=UPI001B38017D|nr:AraC family transcriptional regulator [Pseudoalteromonas luteoviolacea]MBQ4838983.1 helix-turn-helix transcriptional regulator [Pseudoalteromonas luteoviolacea]
MHMIAESQSLFALQIATLSVIVISAHQLLLRARNRQVYRPLAVCLLAIGFITALPISKTLLPVSFQVLHLIFCLPALLLVAPSLWLYSIGLTNQTPWSFQKRDIKHFAPSGFGCLVALVALIIPEPYRYAILVNDNLTLVEQAPILLRSVIYGLLIVTFGCVLGWIVQSAWYFYKLINRLHHYHEQLKDVFASTEQKELRWLIWLLISVGGVWLFIALDLFLDNLFSPIQFDQHLYAMMLLLLVYSLALWGLRQKPGFTECYELADSHEFVSDPTSSEQVKYQRSALDHQRASQIVTKLEHAMVVDKCYLDANLSLPKLAKHIHTPSHYISQTLNETLGMRFFDFVNQHRVDAAKQLLAQEQDAILTVAMEVGFNSKSAFYTAFKKHTTLTPSDYRKQHQIEGNQ